jgi:MoxR-like ATPase
VGVIGVALFRERMAAVTLPYPASAAREAAGSLAEAAPAPAAPAAASPMHERRADAKLGTGHGPREVSQVAQTAFERRASEPDEVIRIRYDSRDNLIALGVLPREGAPRPPNPFPDSPAVSRYVPDPPPRY